MKFVSTETKIFSGFLFAILCIGIFAVVTYNNMKLTTADSREVSSSLAILRIVEEIYTGAQDIESGYAKFVITGKEIYLQKLAKCMPDQEIRLESLLKLSKSDSALMNEAAALSLMLHKHMDYAEEVINIRKKGGDVPAIEFVKNERGIYFIRDIRKLVNTIEERERKVLLKENKAKAERSNKTALLFILLGSIVFLFLSVSFIMIRNEFRANKKANERISSLGVLIEKNIEIESILDRITDAFVALDKKWCFTYVNIKAEELLQKKSTEIIGKQLLTVFPTAANNIEVAMNQAFTNQQVTHYEYFSPLFKKWVQSDIYPSPAGLSVFFRDITEQKEHADELKASEEKYRTLVEQASDAILISDDKGKYIDVNPGACKLLGYTREELLQLSSQDLLLNQADIAKLPRRYSDLIKGVSFISERKLKTKQGAAIDVETHGKMLPDGRFMGIVRDITERKRTENALRESEIRYRSLVEQASDGIFLYDVNGELIDVNSSGCKMLGYTTMEIKNKKLHDLFFESDIEIAPLRFDEQLQGKTVLSERMLKRKDGSSIAVEINTRMLHDGNFLGIARDISKRKQTEQELQKINRELSDLSSNLQTVREQERASIAREIHDELGQQLTALKMDASWIAKRLTSTPALQKIGDMIALLDDTVKTVRRISADLRPIILDDVGLIAALEWQCHEFSKRISTNCSLHSEFTELHFSKETDIGVFRICQESLTNAARHAHAKHIETTIKSVDEAIVIIIKDDGVGFDITQAKDKKTLGITGMKERARMFGGNVKLVSKKGIGTSITITIPLEKDNHQVAI